MVPAPRRPRPHAAALALAACLPSCVANGLDVVLLGARQSSDPEPMRLVAMAPRRNITQASIAALFDLGFAGVECQVRNTLDRRLVAFDADSLAGVAPETCPDEICGEEAHTRLTQADYTRKIAGSLTQATWAHMLEHVTLSNGHKLTLLEDIADTPEGKYLVFEPASRTNPGEPAGFLRNLATDNNWPTEKMQVLFGRRTDAGTFGVTFPNNRLWFRHKVHDSAHGWQYSNGRWFEGAAGSLDQEARDAIDIAARGRVEGADMGVTFEASAAVLTEEIDTYRHTSHLALAAFGWDKLDGSDHVAGALAMRRLPAALYSFTTHVTPDVEAWMRAGQPDVWPRPTQAPPSEPGGEGEEPGGSSTAMIVGVIVFLVMVLAVFAHVSSTKGDAKEKDEEVQGGSSVEMKAGRV